MHSTVLFHFIVQCAQVDFSYYISPRRYRLVRECGVSQKNTSRCRYVKPGYRRRLVGSGNPINDEASVIGFIFSFQHTVDDFQAQLGVIYNASVQRLV
jgi:hypothetical protein